jgi:transcription elongation GreA/GreB family factor
MLGSVVKIEKRRVVEALLAHLDEEIATMTKAARTAAEAATHEEAKPENDKDTRALEASYLAAGQAERVRTLETAVKTIRGLTLRDLSDAPIQATSIVTLEDDDGARTTFFMAPVGGGTSLSVNDATLQVVTPQSPLGQALLGRSNGEVVELRGKGGVRREMTIVDLY